MFWCFCGDSIKNIDLPSVIDNSKGVKVEIEEKKEEEKKEEEKKEEEKKEEVEKIVEVEEGEKKEFVEEKEVLEEDKIEEKKEVDSIRINKKLESNKCECKIYNFENIYFENIYHIVLEEPYNMIIIINHKIDIIKLSNIQIYNNKDFDYIYVDKNWITECYKLLNDIEIIEIKKILLRNNISNIKILNDYIVHLKKDSNLEDIISTDESKNNIFVSQKEHAINANIYVDNENEYIMSNSNISINSSFNPATIFLKKQTEIENILPNQLS